MDKNTPGGSTSATPSGAPSCGLLIILLGLGVFTVALVNKASPWWVWVSALAIVIGWAIALATPRSEKPAGQDARRQHESTSGIPGDQRNRRPGSVRGLVGQGRKFDAITLLQKRDGLTYKAALRVVEKLEAEREPPARIEEARSIPPHVRQAVLDRDDYICRYCGRRSQTIEVDHVIPVSQGGTSTLGNLVTSCRGCNRKKGGRKPEEAGMEVLTVRTRRRDRD